MKKIYIGMTSGYGPLAQALPIVNILKEDKDIEIISNMFDGASREVLGSLGFTLRELTKRKVPENVIPSSRQWWDMGYFFGKLGYLEFDYVNSLVSDCVALFKKEKIALVISVLDPIAAVASKILNIPLVSISQSCFHPKKVYDRIRWWEEMPVGLTDVVGTFNRILEEHSLKTMQRVEELFESELTIIPSIKEFDPVTSDSNVYTGIMCWGDCDEKGDIPFGGNTDRKTIYVYSGRMEDSGGKSGEIILENVLEAFKDSPYNVLVTTGVGELPDEYKNREYPSNIIVQEWVPVSKIINSIDLVIHHGGHGISLQCIAVGKPSLVIPTHDEREYNARQLKKLGIGEFIQPEKLNPENLRNMAASLIEDEVVAENAEKLVQKISETEYTGAKGAAELIRNLLKNK